MRRIAPLLALVWIACLSEAEVLRPAPVDGTGGSTSTVVTTTTTTTSGAGPTKRTIIQRNPFGNVKESGNLLWDGDFEWLTPFADQYGWLSGPQPGQLSYQLPTLEIGVKCRSGVKCARLASNAIVVGIAVGSQSNPLSVSVWSNVTDGACEAVSVLLVPQNGTQEVLEVTPVSSQADEDGWCNHSATSPELTSAPWLFIHNTSGADIVVDNAVIKVAESSPEAAHALAQPSLVDMTWLRQQVHELTRPRVAPPNEAVRAFKSKHSNNKHSRRQRGGSRP